MGESELVDREEACGQRSGSRRNSVGATAGGWRRSASQKPGEGPQDEAAPTGAPSQLRAGSALGRQRTPGAAAKGGVCSKGLGHAPSRICLKYLRACSGINITRHYEVSG